jgi:hypothetical protein
MKPAITPLLVGFLLSACSAAGLPLPSGTPDKSGVGRTPAKPACADQFSEPACQVVDGCRWIAPYRRADGTYASPYCVGGSQ